MLDFKVWVPASVLCKFGKGPTLLWHSPSSLWSPLEPRPPSAPAWTCPSLYILQTWNPPTGLLQAILLRTVAEISFKMQILVCFYVNDQLFSNFFFKPFQWNEKQGTWSPTMRLAVFRGHFLSWIPSMNSPYRRDCSPLRHSKQATSRMRRLTESHDYVGSQRLFIHSEIFTERQALC